MSSPPSSHIAHYRVLSRLGGGGGGEVFRCLDERLGREVAVKVMPDAQLDDARAIARFRREARVGLGLSHPHICAVYDAGTFEGRDYIVMELLHGAPLASLIAARPLPLPRLLELALQIVDALDAAHERDIVHRDVKPANIFVTEKGLVKLLDFGIARSADRLPGDRPSLTGERAVIGTPTHMAPERVLGAAADARADVFSLGVTLYQMGTARLPFPGATVTEVLSGVLHRDPAAPSSLNPRLPEAFDRIVLRALAKQPERRYPDVAKLRDDLLALRLRAAGSPSAHGRDPAGADAPTAPLHAWPIHDAFLIEPWDAVARDSRDFAEQGVGVMHWFGVPLGAISHPDGFRSAMLPALENRLVTELRFTLDAASPGAHAAWAAHVLPQVALWSKRRDQGVEVREEDGGGVIVRRDGGALVSWRFRDLSLEFGPAFKLFAGDAPGARADAQVYIATFPREVSGLDGRVAHVGVPETVMRVRGDASAPLLAALLRRARGPLQTPTGAR